MTDSVLAPVRVAQVAGNIGAEISGVDTGSPVSDETVAAIRQSLLKHKVVFLRDQDLDYPRQVAFAQRLGPLTLGHPTIASPPGQPLLEEIDSRKGSAANYWHTDVTFVDRPPAFTLLHLVAGPPVGGDTIWANTVTAYHALPPELRDLAEGLRVRHTNEYDYARPFVDRDKVSPELLKSYQEFVSTVFEAEHPLVRVHPETGERALVLGGFAKSVVGLPPVASRDLIRVFSEYITRPEHTVRWRWREGDLAIWDNRATQHYAIADYGSSYRRGERVTVAGPAPVGTDGRPSIAIKGDASAYYAGGANH